ncbi:MAG: hypothetical protein FWG11_06725 [Promicromonosporaceae bacterium]|nr:hypothetical protein [Promicromonosporaceae bacterium]
MGKLAKVVNTTVILGVASAVGLLALRQGLRPVEQEPEAQPVFGGLSEMVGDDTSGFVVARPTGLQPLPEHGATRWFVTGDKLADCQRANDLGNAGDLVLSIPADTAPLFIKLSDESGPVYGVMLYPGRPIAITAPLCGDAKRVYTLTYATGPAWYGWEEYFGPGGSYSFVDTTFEFDRFTNWDVELNLDASSAIKTAVLDFAAF